MPGREDGEGDDDDGNPKGLLLLLTCVGAGEAISEDPFPGCPRDDQGYLCAAWWGIAERTLGVGGGTCVDDGGGGGEGNVEGVVPRGESSESLVGEDARPMWLCEAKWPLLLLFVAVGVIAVGICGGGSESDGLLAVTVASRVE